METSKIEERRSCSLTRVSCNCIRFQISADKKWRMFLTQLIACRLNCEAKWSRTIGPRRIENSGCQRPSFALPSKQTEKMGLFCLNELAPKRQLPRWKTTTHGSFTTTKRRVFELELTQRHCKISPQIRLYVVLGFSFQFYFRHIFTSQWHSLWLRKLIKRKVWTCKPFRISQKSQFVCLSREARILPRLSSASLTNALRGWASLCLSFILFKNRIAFSSTSRVSSCGVALFCSLIASISIARCPAVLSLYAWYEAIDRKLRISFKPCKEEQ